MPNKLNALDAVTLAVPSGAWSGVKAFGALAGSPDSLHLLGAETLSWPARNAFNMMIGANIHDIPHLMFSKSNAGGRKIQTMIVADGIVASKAATEGKVFANRTPLGMWISTTQMPKALAMHETNLISQNVPHGRFGFLDFRDNNKLNVKRIKTILGAVGTADKAAFATQVIAPAVLGAKGYLTEKEHGGSVQDALKAGMKGVAIGGAISAGLVLPRKLMQGGASLHHILNQDGGHGYKILEDASVEAAKVINSPKSYYKHLYKTPEENLKANAGFPGTLLKKMLGQTPAKGYDPHGGYFHTEHGEDLPFDVKVKNRARNYINKVFGNDTPQQSSNPILKIKSFMLK